MLFKNNTIGIASMLFFVVLVSHSRVLDFLFETFLGRIFLIGMILFISYKHYILGVVSVLIAIIMFNNIGYMEGMESRRDSTTSSTTPTTSSTTPTTSSTSSTPTTSSTTTTPTTSSTTTTPTTSSTTTSSTTTTPTTSSSSTTTKPTTSSISASLASAMSKAKNNVMSKLNTSATTTPTTSSSTTTTSSTEGFDLIGTENTLKRGKQSNSIPVYHHSNNGGHVAPYDGGSAYSAF